MRNFILFLMFTTIMSLTSCGARKVDKQVLNEETETKIVDNSVSEKESESNVKTTILTKVDDKNETVTEETIYQPEDPTKEAIITDENGKKTILNNSKKTIKKITQKNNIKSESKSDSQIIEKEAIKDEKDIKASSHTDTVKKSSKTDRDADSMWNWLWLLIPVGIIIWLFRKYRDKIWWV